MYTYNIKRMNHLKKFNSDNIAERWISCLNKTIETYNYDINSEFLSYINKDNKKAFEIFEKITEFDNNSNSTYWNESLREIYNSYNKYGREYIFTFVIPYAKDVNYG